MEGKSILLRGPWETSIKKRESVNINHTISEDRDAKRLAGEEILGENRGGGDLKSHFISANHLSSKEKKERLGIDGEWGREEEGLNGRHRPAGEGSLMTRQSGKITRGKNKKDTD